MSNIRTPKDLQDLCDSIDSIATEHENGEISRWEACNLLRNVAEGAGLPERPVFVAFGQTLGKFLG